MPILNYTTVISASKTVGEIIGTLTDLGANEITTVLDSSRIPVGVRFKVLIADNSLEFRLPCKWQGVYKTLQQDSKVPKALKTEEQARKVAWRIIKDWIEAQMAIIQSETAELAEVFLPYLVFRSDGPTLFEDFQERQLQLVDGTEGEE